MNQRRLSLPSPKLSITPQIDELLEEYDHVNFDSLEALLEELHQLHSYGVQLLKVIKQKYVKISGIPDTILITKLKTKICLGHTSKE